MAKKSIIDKKPSEVTPSGTTKKDLKAQCDEARKKLILDTYIACDGVLNQTARALGISRVMMQIYKKKYNIL